MASDLRGADVLDLKLAAACGGRPIARLLEARLLRREAWHHLWAEFANALGRLLLVLLLAGQRWHVPSLDGEVDHYFLRRGVEVVVCVHLGQVRHSLALILRLRGCLPLVLQVLGEVQAVLPLKPLAWFGIHGCRCRVLHRIQAVVVCREGTQAVRRRYRCEILERQCWLTLLLEELPLRRRMLTARLQCGDLVL